MNRITSDYKFNVGSVRNQRTYTKLDNFKIKFVAKCLMLGAFIVLLSLVYIWSRIQIVQAGYGINELKKEQSVLKDDTKRLQMEHSLLKSPERIEDYATIQLKMSLPNQTKIIKIN